jgi:hypothetical protein
MVAVSGSGILARRVFRFIGLLSKWVTSNQWAMELPSSQPVTFPAAARQGK